ncbi:hypothetical protein B0T25DRAFT_309512 [Lasiosphaeria hispida]|uniref:Uncharacterized protein n=1 Tax=Lasiosphaeria hispida TaxID=260671 RepID=A0AAJ0H8P4_9PEZI|nr:hypothetical protein B0T25DRAFT_309512 [Lasiosphaeria hispida]
MRQEEKTVPASSASPPSSAPSAPQAPPQSIAAAVSPLQFCTLAVVLPSDPPRFDFELDIGSTHPEWPVPCSFFAVKEEKTASVEGEKRAGKQDKLADHPKPRMPPTAEMQQAGQASGQDGRHAAEVPMHADEVVILEAPAPAPAPVNNKAPIPSLLFPFWEYKPLGCSGTAQSSETSHEPGVGASATPEPKQGVFNFNLDSMSSPQWPRRELDPSGKSSHLFPALRFACCHGS